MRESSVLLLYVDVAHTFCRFHNFFHQLDNYRTDFFLWVTPGGFEAAHERVGKGTEKIPKQLEAELGDEKDGIEE